MRLKRQWSMFGKQFLFLFQTMKTPKTLTMGIESRISHTTNFVVFLDYDNIKDERLDDELVFLQESYQLGDFYIFETSEHGRHAICIDWMLLREALEVVYNSTCDWMFKRGIRLNEFRTWILRCWEKGERERPKFSRTVESPYNGQRLQSQSHASFLKAHFGVSARRANPDGNDEIEIQSYNTSSKVTVKDLEKETKKHGYQN